MSQFNGTSYTDCLTQLHAQCFEKPWTAESFSCLLQLPTTFGFIEEGGFILCSDLGQDVEILTLAVSPFHRRQGLATQLLNNVKDFVHAHNKEHIFLEVSDKNEPAKALYLKNGFVPSGVRKNYYHETQGTVDALCLVWNKS